MERTARSSVDQSEEFHDLMNDIDDTASEPVQHGSLWEPDAGMQTPRSVRRTAGVTRSSTSSPSRSTSNTPLASQRRTGLISLEDGSSEGETSHNTTQFDPPLRSIFASGQPTSSISNNTARASLSTTSPGNTSRQFVALANSSINRRLYGRHADSTSSPTIVPHHVDYTMLGTEKDVDDPATSSAANYLDVTGPSTSQALSSLFAASERSSSGRFSRQTTFGRSSSNMGKPTVDTTSLAGHLLHVGFEEGRHSDITIHAFGHQYKLHKLMLERISFFSTAFSGPWTESSANEMTLMPEEIDTNITQNAFELALKRIYGTVIPLFEEQEAIGLFATACWLDMPDLVDCCIEHILRQMQPSRLASIIGLVTNNYYGKAGDRVLSSAKAMLCRDGFEMPYEYWDNIPANIVQEIIGGDPFYVPGEWERWFLAQKLLNRRLRRLAIESGLVSTDGHYIHPRPKTLRYAAVRPSLTLRRSKSMGGQAQADEHWRALYVHPDITPLLMLLDEGIHYVHLRFEQLQVLRSYRDILGVPILPETVISDALWMSMELRQRVLNAHDSDLELGLSEIANDGDDFEEIDEHVAEKEKSKGKDRDAARSDNKPADVVTSEKVIDEGPRRFWIPTSDVSCVMGGSREACAVASFGSSAEWTSHSQRLSSGLEPTDVVWPPDLGGSILEPNPRSFSSQQPPRFTQYPPFRFCAEFPNPRTLKEKKRFYSQTVWYAGSMWNLYIQRVNTSKNQQLGIYLHRAKDKEPIDDPLALTVDDRIGQLEREMLLRKSERRHRQWRATNLMTGLADVEIDDEPRGGEQEGFSPWVQQVTSSLNPRSPSTPMTATTVTPTTQAAAINISANTTQSPGTSQSSLHTRPSAHGSASSFSVLKSSSSSSPPSQPPGSNLSLPLSTLEEPDESTFFPHATSKYTISTIPPYTDVRPTVKTYFKIYSPSKAGRLLSVYESAPDNFNFGKSWGWKSSQMVLDDGIESGFGRISGLANNSRAGGGGGTGTGTGTSDANSIGARGSAGGSGTLGNNYGGLKDGRLRYMVVIGNI